VICLSWLRKRFAEFAAVPNFNFVKRGTGLSTERHHNYGATHLEDEGYILALFLCSELRF
jgi:hypothetical protein